MNVGPLVRRYPVALAERHAYPCGASGFDPPNKEYPPPKPGEPPLHRAARTGDHDLIRALVAEGADVDQLFEIQLDPGARQEPATPLLAAAGSGNGASIDTVALLLEIGASPNGGDGLPPLPYACGGRGWNYPPGGDAARVAALLAAGADPNSQQPNGSSALANAARTGDADRVRSLLQAGADPVPNATKDVGEGLRIFLYFRDPLTMAAESGSAACVRMLLDAGAGLDRYPEDDQDPLSRAGSSDALSALLGAGADPNREARHQSVVESVARNGDVSVEERIRMLRVLYEAGADLNRSGRTNPLFGAAMEADAEAVEALLRAGADCSRRPNGLAGVCFSAFSAPNPDVDRVVDLLVAAGLDPNDTDEAGLRPLHSALSPDQYGPDYAESDGFNEPAALALLRHGAGIDITFPDTGYAPLHAAATEGSIAVAKGLLAAGADPVGRTPQGQTPADVAREHGHEECAAFLANMVDR